LLWGIGSLTIYKNWDGITNCISNWCLTGTRFYPIISFIFNTRIWL